MCIFPFTLVLLKIFDVHLFFFGVFSKLTFRQYCYFAGGLPKKVPNLGVQSSLPCIPYGTLSAMMLFKHDSFYMKIFIDD